MIDDVILHIGMHKTGSTSIQAALNGYDSDSVRYAQLGMENHSLPLHALFNPDPYRHPAIANLGMKKWQISVSRTIWKWRLAMELRRPAGRLILSGEDISTLPAQGVANLRAALFGHSRSVTVTAFIRDPVSYPSSAYTEHLKSGMAAPKIQSPRYRQRFAKFLEQFTRDACLFIPYLPELLKNGCVVADFCHRLGIPEAGTKPDGRKNERPTLESLQLLAHFNQHGCKGKASRHGFMATQRLIASLNTIGSTKFNLATGEVDATLDWKDIAWAKHHLGIDFDIDALLKEHTATEQVDLRDISGQTVAELKQLLDHSKIPWRGSDSTVDLLNRLYRRHLRDCRFDAPLGLSWRPAAI